MDNTINIKLVILGEGGIGKTSIVNSFMGNQFPEQYLPTIGSKTNKKEFTMKEKGNITRVLLSMWDIGGQRSFNPFNPTLYKDIDIALLVFDLTKPKETLKNLKDVFLNHITNHSENVLSIYIGNKLDSISNEQQIITSLTNFLDKNDIVIFLSAKTAENINECFELLIYTFLRKAEILYPDIVPNNTAKLFLNLIDKSEKELKTRLINLKNLNLIFKKQKIKPKVKEKVDIKKKEIKDLKYYDFLKQELERNSTQKTHIMDQFLINLSELSKTIKHLKKKYSKSGNELIDNLKELLITSQKDFEQNVDLMAKLNREEFELVKIISKNKENQLELESSMPR